MLNVTGAAVLFLATFLSRFLIEHLLTLAIYYHIVAHYRYNAVRDLNTTDKYLTHSKIK